MLKICERCWKEFKTSYSKVKCCSVDCSSKLRTKYQDKECITCWKLFHPLNSSQKFCSLKCRDWRKQETYKCLYCWKEFQWWIASSTYCSEECKRLYNKNNNEEVECQYCWKLFHPWHKWWKYCSNECKRNSRKTIQERECPICWEIFKPAKDDKKYCSKECYSISQSNGWKSLSKEEQDYIVSRMVNWVTHKISSTNIKYKNILEKLWYSVILEKQLWWYFYDLAIWNVLIEINPRVFHNFTRAPKWEPKTSDYHYNKVKYGIDNGYNVIMVRDRTPFDELIQLLDSDFIIVQHVPKVHRYNYKTKEHIIWSEYDRESMEENWFVLIYDWGEEYIYI